MKKIVIPLLKGNMLCIRIDHIKYFHSDGPVVYIVDDRDKSHASNKTLRYFEELVSEYGFFKFSQSLIVNLSLLYYFDQVNQEVELICSKRLSMSRSGAKRFKEFVAENQNVIVQ